MTAGRGPIPNSYRLPGGRVIAGEYPGDWDDARAREKLGALLEAGVGCFIDLTEEGELDPYEEVLREEAAARAVEVSYVRLSIPDFSVPESPAAMCEILDAIDAACGEGRMVYVHCWGGVGRTGTVIGCHLVRSGLSGEDALARLAELWQSVEKYPRSPRSPETQAQAAYVRGWAEPPSGAP